MHEHHFQKAAEDLRRTLAKLRAAKAKPRTATARLSDILVSEVSLVDRPANLRPFLLTKKQGAPLAMSPQTKQDLLDGVADALERLVATASVIGEATTDETAETPEEVLSLLRSVGTDLVKLSGQAPAPANVATTKSRGGASWPDDFSAYVQRRPELVPHEGLDLSAHVAAKARVEHGAPSRRSGEAFEHTMDFSADVAARARVAKSAPTLAAPPTTSGARCVRILKAATGEQQLVYGIVLEPDVVDGQGDTYSADEIEKAAHEYLRDFRNAGLQHRQLINNRAKVVESWVNPAPMTFGGVTVKAGTWLMAMRVEDSELWQSIKSGAISGFSIGGVAAKTPMEAGA